jgi:hypothetical protein
MRSILFWFLFLANALSLISQETFPLNGAENSVSPTPTFINTTLHAGASNAIENATLIISKGDALDMMTNNIISAYIEGRSLELTNR